MKSDPANQPSLPPLVPDHELLRRIGAGSYGEVWLARNVVGGYRAVKIVYRKTFDNDRPYEREFNGIKEYEPVSHSVEGLVHLLHVGRNDAEGCFYYVMELADDQQSGQQINPDTYQPKTLRSEISRRGRLPFEECLPLGLSLAAALGRLHGQRLVHRDVKPSNIIFVNGVPKLADIGLVTSLDSTRSFVGTEGYVPLDGPGTPRADVYALGKVLYEASTGRDRQDYPELPTRLKDFVDKEAVVKLNEVIVRACDPEPRSRYQSATEMQADLLLLQEGKRLVKRRALRHPLAWVVLLAAGLVLGGLIVISSLFPKAPTLRLVRQIQSPDLPHWDGDSTLADWNGDGVPDVLAVQSNRFVAVSTAGKLLAQWRPPDTNAQGFGLDWVSHGDRDEEINAFVDWRSGDNHTIAVLQPDLLDHEGYRIKFEAKGVLARHGQDWVSGTSLRALKVVDLRRDGKRQLLAWMNSGHGRLLRGLYSFGFEDQTFLWRHLTAPAIYDVECLDLDGDGQMEIVCGSSAPNNGNQAEDGTDDSQSYIFAFRSDGELLWKTQLGPELSQSRPVVVRLDGTRRKGVFAYVSFSGEDWRREKGLPAAGLIVKLDGAGNVTHRREVDKYIHDCAAGDLDADDQEELILTLFGGELLALRADLTLKDRWSPESSEATNTILRLVGIGDLTQDGRPELAVLSGQYQLASPVYLGRPGEPVTQRLYLNNRLHILDHRLRPLAEHPLADQWNHWLWGLGQVGDFERTGRTQLLFIADKPYVVELQPRQFFGLW